MARFGRLLAASLLLLTVLPALPAGATAHGPPEVHVEDASATEGNGSATAVDFTIRTNRPLELGEEITVHYETADGTATSADGDYVGRVDSVTMDTSHNEVVDASTTVSVLVEGDGRDEGDEDFTLTLTDCTDCDIDDSNDTGTGTIQDDDPYVTIDGPVVTEGTDAAFTVSLTEAAADDVEVDLAIADGSATEGEDYAAPTSKSVTIPAGTTSVPVAFPTTEDGTAEGCETFTATIDVVTSDDDSASAPDTGATATAVITDQPSAAIPCLTVGDVTVVEGDGPDHATAHVPISIAPATTETVVVDYATTPGTAAAYLEYLPDEGQLSIDAGETAATIPVTVLGDRIDEVTESFTVELSTPTDDQDDPVEQDLSLPAEPTTVQVTITDDDGAPDSPPQSVSVCVNDAERDEGDPGQTPTMDFQVDLQDADCGTDGASAITTTQPITLEYATSDGTGDDSAEDGSSDFEDEGTGGDFEPENGAVVVIPAGVQTGAVPITVIGDDKHEPDEPFTIEGIALGTDTDVQTTTVETASATGTILNDDPVPAVSVGDITDEEGDAFEKAFELPVELSNPSSQDFDFVYDTADGTATAEEDYEPQSGETVTVTAGDTSATITVLVQPDTVEEPDETFFVQLDTESIPEDATVDDGTGTGTIVNDDGPAFSIADASVTEGEDFGTTTMSFTVTLDPARDGEATSVDFATQDPDSIGGDEEVAVAGEDYHATSGTLTFDPGQTSGTIEVAVVGDERYEADQVFEVALSNPDNAVIHRAVATGTIVDDDEDAKDGAPVAVVDGPDSGKEGETVTFDASASYDPDGEIAEYAWAFDDGGGSARGETVQHTLRDDGTLTVGLRVTDDDGKQTTTSHEVTVSNAPPTPSIEISGKREPSSLITFSGGGTDPGGDALSSFAWEFGDGATASGQQVTHAFEQRGTYEVTLHATDEDGATGTTTTTFEIGPDTGTVERVAGPGRYETAVAASQMGWDTANDAVLATGENFADALAAGPLAAALDAPLLLTSTASLHPDVADELSRLGVARVWIMGGTSAVGQAVEDQLTADGYQIERFAGPNRFATAAIVAAGLGPSDDGEVLLALGSHPDPSRAFPDSLSAGALSVVEGGPPVLLTAPDALPTATKRALGFMAPTTVTLIGGEAAISASVADELTSAGLEVRRLAGVNRYGTSAAVAADALQHHENFDVPVVFATGQNFPDGLSAAPLAARLGGLIVLVPGTGSIDDTPDLQTLLTEQAQRFDLGVAVGGNAVITDGLTDQVTAVMTGTS